MVERESWYCGTRGWTIIAGWLQITMGILALLDLGKNGFVILRVMKPEKYLHEELSPTIVSVLLLRLIMPILSIIMAIILLCGCKNKNPKQLNIWIIYAKISLVVYVLLISAKLFVIPEEKAPWRLSQEKTIFFCIEVAIQVFCIWVVGFHKNEIETSSGTVVAFEA